MNGRCFKIPIDGSSMDISSLDDQFYAPFKTKYIRRTGTKLTVNKLQF